MEHSAQNRAVENYRHRLKKEGVARFEVLGLPGDRKLIRSLAKRLLQDEDEADRIRSEVMRSMSEPATKGGIFAALRRSPLVGSELRFERTVDAGRKVDL